MTDYTLTVELPGVISGVVQNGNFCHKCRGTLLFKRVEKGRYSYATQMIATCARCGLEQAIEGQCRLVRR